MKKDAKPKSPSKPSRFRRSGRPVSNPHVPTDDTQTDEWLAKMRPLLAMRNWEAVRTILATIEREWCDGVDRTPIATTNLSRRCKMILSASGVFFVGRLRSMTDERLQMACANDVELIREVQELFGR